MPGMDTWQRDSTRSEERSNWAPLVGDRAGGKVAHETLEGRHRHILRQWICAHRIQTRHSGDFPHIVPLLQLSPASCAV